jgi:hypothetical protein
MLYILCFLAALIGGAIGGYIGAIYKTNNLPFSSINSSSNLFSGVYKPKHISEEQELEIELKNMPNRF